VRRETKLYNAFNVMDSKMLSSLHHLLDALLREIHREAVGASKKPTACSYRLWGITEAVGHGCSQDWDALRFIQRCLYNGMNFILRGGDTHMDLSLSLEMCQIQTMILWRPSANASSLTHPLLPFHPLSIFLTPPLRPKHASCNDIHDATPTC